MSDIEIKDFECLAKSINLKEDATKQTFEFFGCKFRIPKSSDNLRKKMPATRYLQAVELDRLGMMSGNYDDVVYHIMSSVILEEESKMTTLSRENYDQFLFELPEFDDDGDPLQLTMICTLPEVVASLLVGKRVIQKMEQKITTSAESTEPAENKNT